MRTGLSGWTRLDKPSCRSSKWSDGARSHPGRGRPASARAAPPPGRDPGRDLRGDGDLGEHAVPAGIRRPQADAGAAAGPGPRPSGAAGRTGRHAGRGSPGRTKALKRNGRTLIPLTRQPGGIRAYKMIIPAGEPAGDQQSHEGYEWMYVLSGRLRLRLGEHDFVMKAGEVAEFDTRTQHWFGADGSEPVEVLTLFGPQGERIHVRARPRSRS